MAETVIVRAYANGVRQSPRKVGLVASLVRGRSVSDALTILDHTAKRAAKPVVKAIASAKANAVTTHSVNEASLHIVCIQVTAGPRLKRYRPAAHGRALPYQKRSSHILVELSGEVKAKKTAVEKAPAKKQPVKKESE